MSEGDTEQVGPFYYVGEGGFEAWGFTFPSGLTVLEWDKNSVPDDEEKLDGYHQSVYDSFEDMRKICTGQVDWGVSPDDFGRGQQDGQTYVTEPESIPAERNDPEDLGFGGEQL